MRKGYIPENAETAELVSRWLDAPPVACLGSRSVDFLRRTGRNTDLDFILGHIDDLHSVFTVNNGEVHMIPQEDFLMPICMPADRDERPEEAVMER
jgi:2-phosphosulfolactate phosphatase